MGVEVIRARWVDNSSIEVFDVVALLTRACSIVYTVEHMFEVIIENLSGLKLLDNMIWGEADCFVQYHFPAQNASAGRFGGATVVCGVYCVVYC